MRDNSSFFLINFIQHSASLDSGRGAIENLIHSKYLPSLKEGVKSRREVREDRMMNCNRFNPLMSLSTVISIYVGYLLLFFVCMFVNMVLGVGEK